MASRNDPKTLEVMDQAFAAIWKVLKAGDPFRDYAKDDELRIAVGQKLLNLVADGVTNPVRLRQLTVESLFLPGHWRSNFLSLSPAAWKAAFFEQLLMLVNQREGNQLQEKHTDWLTFVAQYRDGSFEHFAVDPFTLLTDNYIACDDARERQEEGSLKLGEIVLVYRDRRLVASWGTTPSLDIRLPFLSGRKVSPIRCHQLSRNKG
jgi:hypothetical protein